MIILSFAFPEAGSPWLKTWEHARTKDVSSLGETELRYKYFAVRPELVVDGVDLVSKDSFVTLVDMALSLAFAAKRIAAGEDAVLGFTETSDVIRFIWEGELVRIKSSENDVNAVAAGGELSAEMKRFVRAAYSRLVAEIPGLSVNPVLDRINLDL